MEPPQLDSLADLEKLVLESPELFIRYSEGPAADGSRGSMDTESGIELPGLSVNPLSPEPWWTRPLRDWLARQLCQYRELREKNPAKTRPTPAQPDGKATKPSPVKPKPRAGETAKPARHTATPP